MKINIPQPCHESWESMKPLNGQSRFCEGCQKSVIDFSHFSDQEIVDFFKKAQHPICGRMNNSQLNRAIIPSPKKSWLPSTAFFSILLGSWLGLGTVAKAQGDIKIQDERYYLEKEKTLDSLQRNHKIQKDSVVIKGVVYYKDTKENLPGATIRINNYKLGTATDNEGKFEIKIPSEFMEDENILLYAEGVGLQSQSFNVSKININLSLDIFLEESVTGLMDYKRPSIWRRFSNLFRRKN